MVSKFRLTSLCDVDHNLTLTFSIPLLYIRVWEDCRGSLKWLSLKPFKILGYHSRLGSEGSAEFCDMFCLSVYFRGDLWGLWGVISFF